MTVPNQDPVPQTSIAARVRRKDAAANRQALLQAAQTVLADHPNASLDAIAQAAGLSRRALYGHFPDRDSLLREVIAVGAHQFNDIAVSAEHEDPRIALAWLAARLWREASAVRASANIAMDDEHLADTANALAPLRERLLELTRSGANSGAFRSDLSPELLAFLIESTARATLRQPTLSPEVNDATVVRVVLSIVGLSWVEQSELISAHPEVLSGELGMGSES
ncbi:TetR/AcrR family transcriptional regulator [Leucobacter sp. UT-8R-CII-1-4]|uniref:TetR/AcrR family transcriptional regulator n=1 Tax=Leucobacter sp. UT-8R-CII-1-4 TaxID=3040075 RepID=UPI0024A7D4F4|nr:TetR/AcrR family transcriptional regulator [Leucobacter sp. UT-8R-CII-1-4]MDI6021973.1 TetR/AcrR family transcriptional regulator [Leucobacter sp. UT-8R-CII-1-4]